MVLLAPNSKVWRWVPDGVLAAVRAAVVAEEAAVQVVEGVAVAAHTVEAADMAGGVAQESAEAMSVSAYWQS